jgi:hypothetical protein
MDKNSDNYTLPEVDDWGNHDAIIQALEPLCGSADVDIDRITDTLTSHIEDLPLYHFSSERGFPFLGDEFGVSVLGHEFEDDTHFFEIEVYMTVGIEEDIQDLYFVNTLRYSTTEPRLQYLKNTASSDSPRG